VTPLARALGSIYSRVPRGVNLGLGPIAEACARAGSPERAFAAVHVGGTNGKGSVAAMVAAALGRCGLRVGLFTSPHLGRYAERIQVAGAPIGESRLVESLERAIEIGPGLTFFETTFLAAAIAFRAECVEVAVLEVGLGGRLDATNVVPGPLATAVTRVSLDHVDKLGSTLEAIAWEKASIAKPGVPMVLGPMPEEALGAARARSVELGASAVLALGQEVALDRDGDGTARVRVPGGWPGIALRPSLAGAHQLDNAAVAAALCALAAPGLEAVTGRAIEEGIAATRWPGRLERLHDGAGEVLIDCAHNPDGARALAAHLEAIGARDGRGPARTALVFGAVADKDWCGMLEAIGPGCAHRFFVEPGGRSPAPVDEMAHRFGGRAVESVAEALSRAREAVGAGGLVVVAGSIFLAGEVRAGLLGLVRDPPVAM
jgi:dihydrofolate synthase/folylpolyglutamate synthase